ncbi:hypothetical protein GCM10009737_29430 [Nocardioides lentus]|uniref:AbiEi antitoxin C-terminal domain-containing protein n=1 Tax=Nocardioides lentus TaxID=338077 RepID=A0ABN2PMG7_9ACTN
MPSSVARVPRSSADPRPLVLLPARARHGDAVPELPPAVAALARHQDGVVSRRQLVAAGVEPHEVRCRRRGRLLTPGHDGVHVLHTGALTTRQREWAAVLWAAPAALYGSRALGPGIRQRRGGEGPVHVAVDAGRRVRATTGVTVHRVVDLAARVQLDRAPPRVRVEEAVLDAAAGCEDDRSSPACCRTWRSAPARSWSGRTCTGSSAPTAARPAALMQQLG